MRINFDLIYLKSYTENGKSVKPVHTSRSVNRLHSIYTVRPARYEPRNWGEHSMLKQRRRFHILSEDNVTATSIKRRTYNRMIRKSWKSTSSRSRKRVVFQNKRKFWSYGQIDWNHIRHRKYEQTSDQKFSDDTIMKSTHAWSQLNRWYKVKVDEESLLAANKIGTLK